jgi:site-specific recombinase
VNWQEIIRQIAQSESSQPYLLRLLIRSIHASGRQQMPLLIDFLSRHEAERNALREYIIRIFAHKSILKALTESGIYKSTGFTSEIIRRLKHSILPELEPRQSINHTLGIVFPRKKDDKWLASIQAVHLEKLFETLDLKVDFESFSLRPQLIEAIHILSHRIAAAALESEFIHTFRNNKALDVFIQQNNEVNGLLAQYRLGMPPNPHLAGHIISLLHQGLKNINILRKISGSSGASLQLTYILHRLTQQIERLKLLLGFYTNPQLDSNQVVSLLIRLLQYEKSKNRVAQQLSETTYLVTYQIAEHESKTGEHYIAEGTKEYRSFFRQAGKGGVFAVWMACIKIVLHHLHFAPFWQAFTYSINYAAGFVGIQVSHSILATKQPAMTASSIAKSLDRKSPGDEALQNLALTIGKVSRSQFISFAGNLVVVFPLAFIVAWLYAMVSGHQLVNETEARNMLKDVHPWLTPTWYYACITGVFLFISGIISGYYDNKVIYSNIHLRLRDHSILKKILRKRSLIKLTSYIEQNLGSLIGNIALGCMLGTAGFIGFIFGISFDIRHITISSANYAVAVYTLSGQLKIAYALICLLGVIGIGFFNFLVSFGLAIFVAAKSRRIRSAQFDDLFRWVFIYFKKHPLDFFFPPRQERSVELFKKHL